ncbi:MAG: tRNA (adenosine(37)-N6)-threonylcarbamoyltransferase complex ATPase subunit type 1 TsaE [Leptospiraceae bacterium]|nr:tRNA (adenosine(37)-N6)-threonylcarbamoyltransferase complex ATPase subunit type 1 TsaE [Leptospiraceae bacterium]
MKAVANWTVAREEQWPEHWQRIAPFDPGPVPVIDILLLLQGDPGVGKTTLTRYIARFLDIEDNVNSPSFNLLNEYRSKHWLLWHYDLYRLTSPGELEMLDFQDRWEGRYPLPLEKQSVLQVVEWPERYSPDLMYFSKLAHQKPVYSLQLSLDAAAPLSEKRQARLLEL